MPPSDVTAWAVELSSRSINPEETMAATDISGAQLLRKLEGIEERLEKMTSRVKALERHAAELEELKREIGNLKLEVEEFRETD
jgi:predicted RNase H-like nuclease (RuvC/YqgF family)